MTYKIEQIEGIGPHFAERLGLAGVLTTERLLDECKTPAGIQQLEQVTGISAVQLLTWVNRADLMRVSGIGPEFSELLEQCGIETVKQLAERDPANMFQLMGRINAEKHLTRTMPPLKTIAIWVERAKALEPVLVH